MVDVKSLLLKIKNLQDSNKVYKEKVRVNKLMSYLSQIGKHIQMVVKNKKFGSDEEAKLWQYAAKVAHTAYDGSKMRALYERVREEKQKKQQQSKLEN